MSYDLERREYFTELAMQVQYTNLQLKKTIV
jgi:hypothetical protein